MGPVNPTVYSEISEVLTHYDLGELVQFEQNLLGYNNTNFGIRTEKQGASKGYFFRRYKAEILPEEIVFEHAVIDHLIDQDICQVARVFTALKMQGHSMSDRQMIDHRRQYITQYLISWKVKTAIPGSIRT